MVSRECAICARPLPPTHRVLCGARQCINRRKWLADRSRPEKVAASRARIRAWCAAHRNVSRRQPWLIGAPPFEKYLPGVLCSMSLSPGPRWRIELRNVRALHGLLSHLLGEGRVRELLALVTHLGKRRAVGLGRVERWEVLPCEPWEGFPVLRDGRPLRPLPTDWPGLVEYDLGLRTLSYPYWDSSRRVECAVP